MSKHIDIIKKEKVKQSLLKGNNAKQSLIDAGYSYNTATHSTEESVVKVSQAEILAELKAKDITVDLVIRRLNEDRDLALKKQDYATATKVDELLGKYLAMFTEKQQINAHILTQEERSIIDKYISGNRLADKQ